MRNQLKLLSIISAATLLVACGAQDAGIAADNLQADTTSDGKADSATKHLPFSSVTVDLGTQGAKPTRWYVTSKKAFEATFGTTAPSGVKWTTEALYIYSQGYEPTGGYAASVTDVTLTKGGTLRFYDNLDSPASDCIVNELVTKVYTAVKITKPTYTALHYTHASTTRDCAPQDPCKTVTCATGQHCEEEVVECFAAPCPPIAQCVPNLCVQHVLCTTTSHFDNTPGVCACVPNACTETELCIATSHFDNTPGVCACVPNKVTCGGIANRKCPGFGKCSDDPTDNCDPSKGGADCGGVCSCIQTVTCTTTSTFNSDPSVCACVSNS